jgi:hypothetical protein
MKITKNLEDNRLSKKKKRNNKARKEEKINTD